MTRAFIARVLRAWDGWRWKRRLPKPSNECAAIAAKLRAGLTTESPRGFQ